MSRTILVTGAEGFIGSNFTVQAEEKNFNVIELNWNKIVWNPIEYKKKLYEKISQKDIELVVHFGAIASTKFLDTENLIGCNVQSVQIIVDFCVSRNIPLIFTSSSAVYGNQQGYKSLYAETKIKGESIINDTPALRFVILRLFNTYGFNEIKKGEMKSVISDMIISGLQTKKINIWKFTDLALGFQARDFIHVFDVNRIIFELILRSIYPNQTYDLGTGYPHKFIDLATIIGSLGDNVLIKGIKPPEDYMKNYYQRYTCADMTWLKSYNISKNPLEPIKIIPQLNKQYKEFLRIND